MKVLFLTYPSIGLNRCGLQIQIEKTAENLSSIGVEVTFYNPWENQIKQNDICHIFSIDNSMSYHIQRAVQEKIPVIISPILNAFNVSPFVLKGKVFLSEKIPGMKAGYLIPKIMLKSAYRIIALNVQEKNLITKAFGIEAKKCAIVPNGINKTFINTDPLIFQNKYAIKDFVLEVGSVGKRKNQLNLIKAMAKLPYTLVIIGGPEKGNHLYLDECKKAAGKNVIFTGHIDNSDPLLASAFASAKLFVLPSYSEVMPIALYEATATGCKAIASRNFPVAEEISQLIPRFAPDNIDQIAKLIDEQMKTPLNPKLTQLSREMPSWQDVAKQIMDIYKDVTKSR